MATQVQILRKIGACENAQSQTQWSGPAVQACTAPAAFLCEVCGFLLCGSHAGGHAHASSDKQSVASQFETKLAAALARADAAEASARKLQQQLDTAHEDSQRVEQIEHMLGINRTASGAN
jgi:hypothetical protein